MPQLTRQIAPAIAVMVTISTLTAVAQTKSKSSSAKSKSETTAQKEKASKYHRLPSYFGQLELKDEQIAEIYDIRDSFGPKIDALAKELAELREQQDEEIHDVLTRTQVTALNKLKARRKASSDTSKQTSAKSTKSSSAKD